MAVKHSTFFRFLADYGDLVIALFDFDTIHEAELQALIERHRQAESPTPDYIRLQIEELRILEHAPGAESTYELSGPVRELIAWLTRRQRLSSARVLLAYFEDLASAARALDTATNGRDPNAALLALNDVSTNIDRVRNLSEGNQESIVTEAQELRTATDLSAVERFQRVRRLWEQYLRPLHELVAVDGPMDQRLDALHQGLLEGEKRFVARAAVQRRFGRTISRLMRMRAVASRAHHAAMVEIAPLYERLRQQSAWVVGASEALRRIRLEGISPTHLDASLRLVGWRPRQVLSDQKLRTRLAALVGYSPTTNAILDDPPEQPKMTFIPRQDIRDALEGLPPIQDVMQFVLGEWAEYPLVGQLRAYGHIVSGAFGEVQAAEGGTEREYLAKGVRIRAWPLTLRKVSQ